MKKHEFKTTTTATAVIEFTLEELDTLTDWYADDVPCVSTLGEELTAIYYDLKKLTSPEGK